MNSRLECVLETRTPRLCFKVQGLKRAHTSICKGHCTELCDLPFKRRGSAAGFAGGGDFAQVQVSFGDSAAALSVDHRPERDTRSELQQDV